MRLFLYLLLTIGLIFILYKLSTRHSDPDNDPQKPNDLPFSLFDRVYTVINICFLVLGILGLFLSIWLRKILENLKVRVILYESELLLTTILLVGLSLILIIKSYFYLGKENRFKRFVYSLLEEENHE
ncbi:MAG: hypothetical protein H7A23_26215 [Leptospiraceae bacterium]|nr:hypothetical protein [Leptospiraceae bacterium]MCP5498066.1 hypothetical protein [Leptospiraceae bacterium]